MSETKITTSVAVVGAGVSGLTSAVLFAERGFPTTIFAEDIGEQTTSGTAGALWFPYDAEPKAKVIAWALATYDVLINLAKAPNAGVSMIELCQYCRTNQIEIPDWAESLGASALNERHSCFASGFSLRVPLMDVTIYLDYLVERFRKTGGELKQNVRLKKLEDVDRKFELILNCAGIGARELAQDADLEPHRGQVAIVSKLDRVDRAIVCDDDPLTYVIPRTHDCLLGGTNEISDELDPDPDTTSAIVSECARVLKIKRPAIINERVGLRPFRKSGVRLEREKSSDGRVVIHNYGHGGSGFTLSWGCAADVLALATERRSR